MNRGIAICALVVLGAGPVVAQQPSHQELVKQADQLRAQLYALEAKILKPDPSDLEAYQELVGKPDSGVIRLMPRSSDERQLHFIRGGGAYYSFVRLTHEYGRGSDISLERETIRVGFAGADFGWIVALEADSLDAVDLQDRNVAVLAARKVPTTLAEARMEQRAASKGFEDGAFFCNRLPVHVGSVYALRSINYRRSDVLVCLKAHRKEDDGSMVFAWKLLKKFDVPTLTNVGGGGIGGAGGGKGTR